MPDSGDRRAFVFQNPKFKGLRCRNSVFELDNSAKKFIDFCCNAVLFFDGGTRNKKILNIAFFYVVNICSFCQTTNPSLRRKRKFSL